MEWTYQGGTLVLKLSLTADLSPDEQALLDEVPEDGRARVNGPIRRELDWADGRYRQVKAALIEQGHIERARGHGGAVKRCHPTAGDTISPDAPVAAVAGWTADEAALYRLTEWTDSGDYSLVKAECERLGVGLIVFDDPQDADSRPAA